MGDMLMMLGAGLPGVVLALFSKALL